MITENREQAAKEIQDLLLKLNRFELELLEVKSSYFEDPRQTKLKAGVDKKNLQQVNELLNGIVQIKASIDGGDYENQFKDFTDGIEFQIALLKLPNHE